MAIKSIAVIKEEKEDFVSISGPKFCFPGFIKLILIVDGYYCAISRELKNSQLETDIMSRDRIGSAYFDNIGSAINKSIIFTV